MPLLCECTRRISSEPPSHESGVGAKDADTPFSNFDNAVQRIKQWSEKPSPSGGSTATPANGTSSTSNATITSGPNPSDPLTPSQKKRIKQFLKRSRIHPRHSQLNLEGYLLLPVQRIPRYRLLVNS